MSHLISKKLMLVLALTFPAAALADFGGTATIPANGSFDLDFGRVGVSGADVEWDIGLNTIRTLTAVGNAKMFNLGVLNSNGFAAVSSGTLTQLLYPVTGINGNNDSTDVLVVGDVFAVMTNAGNYTKAIVTGYHTNASNPALQDIQIQYYTYFPVFPHMVLGPLGNDVWTTAFILNNTTAGTAPFDLEFVDENGNTMFLDANNVTIESNPASAAQTQSGSGVQGTIPAGGTINIVVSGTAFRQGAATLNAIGVSGQAVFHRHTLPGADYEAAVPLATGGTEYLVPFNATFYFNGTTHVASLPYIAGMALMNLDVINPATINCTILDPNGASLGTAAPVTLPPFGHVALQLDASSGFGNVIGRIGTLDCTSTSSSFTVLGLRFVGSDAMTSFAAIRLH